MKTEFEILPHDLSGRVALVSGAASGIGRACAELLAAAGAAVCLVDIDAIRGRAAADQLRAAGGLASFQRADVALSVDCQRSVAAAQREFGRLDILVNAAGVVQRATVLETDETTWDRIMAVNVKSIYLLSRFGLPIMAQAGGGAVVNIASGWGLAGGRQAAAYCASKGAVVLLSKAMALDHAAEKIRVNCVCPGDTDTPMLAAEADQLEVPLATFLAEAADRPLGRIGTPAEVAQAVLFLASPSAAYITGAVLVVDGGGLAGFG